MKVVLTDMIGFFKSMLPKGKKKQVETEFAVPREQSPLINGANRQQAQRGTHPFETGGMNGDASFTPPPQPGFQENIGQQLPPSFQNQVHEQAPSHTSSHTPVQTPIQAPIQAPVQSYGQNQVIGQQQPLVQAQNTPQFAAGQQNGIEAHPQAGWLTANKVCKTYGKRQVVKQASIRVQRGESVGLLGPNGAGKTTIFYMITGLVKADEGMIHIDGYDVTALPMYRRARLGIGYLPQEASIFRGLTVEQNIMAVLEVTQKNKQKRLEKLESLLDEFNITRLRKSPSIALSGGERRRCEIARALASDPSYILLDEPFAGIDPIAIGDIRDLVRHLTDRGIGVLITDHNVRETLEMIDRAYIIHDGSVLTEGTPQEIVSNDDVRRVYLGDMFG